LIDGADHGAGDLEAVGRDHAEVDLHPEVRSKLVSSECLAMGHGVVGAVGGWSGWGGGEGRRGTEVDGGG
jgi:hypothetical protein